MRPEFIAETVVDLHNDVGFEKLASFANRLTAEELQTNVQDLIEKQAHAEDASYADDMNRMFSIASPIEAKISALYAEKCASLLPEDVVTRINNACDIYDIDIQVPVVNKVASVFDDPAIMNEIEIFDAQYQDPVEQYAVNKYAHANEYGNQLDTCLAARAFYATEPEDVEAIQGLAKMASSMEPDQMVGILHNLDTLMGLDTPAMQQRVGTPEYAVYEKVASDNTVHLGNVNAPFDVVANFQDEIKDLGVDIDWDGDSEDAITLQLESLPSQIKDEIGSWVK